jgi:hypothetical protein
MQLEPQEDQIKDPRATALGQRGGKKRMAQLTAKERSELSRHAAESRWHPLETRLKRERAEELARMVKQAIDDYLPSNKRDMME